MVRTFAPTLGGILFQGDRVTGAMLVNVLTGQTDTVRAAVINATGRG